MRSAEEIVIGHPRAPAEMAAEHTSLQAEAEEAIFYLLDTYRTDSCDLQRVRVTGCRLNSYDSRRSLCSSMTAALTQVSPKMGMLDIDGLIN
jgi:hypothetical protein